MEQNQYSPEQEADIKRRVEKARQTLLELHLQPACIVQSINLGEDVFGMKPIPYLQDTLFVSQKSPIQPKDL